jgi:hypothetical protein
LTIHEISVQQFRDTSQRVGETGAQQVGDQQGEGGPPQLHIEQGLHVEQHLEVDETMPLLEAHELVTNLEAEMRREVPEIASILTHIESEPATIEQPAALEVDRELEVRLRRVAAGFPEILDIHNVFVTRRGPRAIRLAHSVGAGIDIAAAGGGDGAGDGGADPIPGSIQVSCHCTLPDDLSMARVHAVITALEGAFKVEAPEVNRLLIHPEPSTDNRR